MAAISFITGLSGTLQSQYPDQIQRDHVFVPGGNWLVTAATGIPYLGVAELAYGVSDRITIGALYGLTPNVEGYGIRARTILYQHLDNFRIYFCVPVIYYPKTKELGGEPWFLTRPNINFEWVTDSSFRYKFGGSIIAAASQPSLFASERNEEGFKGGTWNAIHGGISFPLSETIMFQTELSAVLNGFTLAGKDWVGGPPVILVIGVSYTIK